MSLNSGTMPQIAIAGYSGSYSERFKTLGQMQLGSLAVLITQPCPVGCSAIRQVADATLRCIGSEWKQESKVPFFRRPRNHGGFRAAMHARMTFSRMQQQRFISPDRIKRLRTCYPAHFFLVPAWWSTDEMLWAIITCIENKASPLPHKFYRE